jgi:hypothetical protein
MNSRYRKRCDSCNIWDGIDWLHDIDGGLYCDDCYDKIMDGEIDAPRPLDYIHERPNPKDRSKARDHEASDAKSRVRPISLEARARQVPRNIRNP